MKLKRSPWHLGAAAVSIPLPCDVHDDWRVISGLRVATAAHSRPPPQGAVKAPRRRGASDAVNNSVCGEPSTGTHLASPSGTLQRGRYPPYA